MEKAVGGLGRASIFDSLLAVLIIELPLFGVDEGVVGFLEVFELGRIASLIRVFLESSFPEGLLDLLSSCILGDFQQLVVLSGVDLLGRLALLPLRPLLVLPLVLAAVLLMPKEHTTISK